MKREIFMSKQKLKYFNSLLLKFKDEILGDKKTNAEIARIARVYEIWENVVDPLFLEHTNAVFIFDEKKERINKKTLVAYLDDSLFASELNARRQEIIFKIKMKFNEDIDEARIIVSKPQFRKAYPFRKKHDAKDMVGVVYKGRGKSDYIITYDGEKIFLPLLQPEIEELDKHLLQHIDKNIENENIKKSAIHAIKAVTALDNELKNKNK